MRKIFVYCFLLCLPIFGTAQAYKFTVEKELPRTPVKAQGGTGTCWSFASTSFIESELIRMGKGEHDLSEMFTVRHNYHHRMHDNFLRRGKGNVSQGSLPHMILTVVTDHGMVPESVYSGINYDSKGHSHGELSTFVGALAEASVKLKKRSPEYMELENSLFDIYLGEVPKTFTYKGKEYTPMSFAKSTGFNPEDYVQITSFTHYPFYETFNLEVPDNWDHAQMYNVPLNEFMEIIDNSIDMGYTVVWDGDVSEKGYVFAQGISILPADPQVDVKAATTIIPEIKVTQELRQQWYETFQTTDDHLEHIVGITRDQKGNKYYLTKNSWGTDRNGSFKGYHHMSVNYVAGKTTSILVHKDVVPQDLKDKLGIK